MPTQQFYESIIKQTELLVQDLGAEFPQPWMKKYADGFVFRHLPQDRSDILASYLKIVRMISLLNASACLMRDGFAQEVFMLCRGIDEASEDVTYFAINLDENGKKKQMKHLKEFYQEQFENPENPLSSTPRDRVSRREIHAAISGVPIAVSDPHTRQKTAKSIHEVFSGFVHGSYVTIMETYGGAKPKFHTKGMLNTPRMADCLENFANYVFRVLIAIEAVAHRIKKPVYAERAISLSVKLCEATGCLDQEGIAAMKTRVAAD